jgi:hypothetical protein
VNFEAYLVSKNIDSNALKGADPELWNTWEVEFSQMHPASFTAQKLYLINPIRRIYPLPALEKAAAKEAVIKPETSTVKTVTDVENDVAPAPRPAAVKPAIPRPVFKPKPKTD